MANHVHPTEFYRMKIKFYLNLFQNRKLGKQDKGMYLADYGWPNFTGNRFFLAKSPRVTVQPW